MSKIENNPANGQYWDDWDEFVQKNMTPEQIAEMEFHAAIIGAFADARDEGKITVEELQKIEDIEDPDLWLNTALKVLFSLGKTFMVVPVKRDIAS